jgi:hypothetical protein
VRFTAEEYAELAAAAARAGLTTTGYVGEATLAAAQGVTATGEVDTSAITRAELAALQRDLFVARTAVTQAAAEFRGVRRRGCHRRVRPVGGGVGRGGCPDPPPAPAAGRRATGRDGRRAVIPRVQRLGG